MKRCTKVVLSLVLLLCVAGIAVPLGISKYYDTYGEYYYKTLIVSKDDAAKADKKISEVRDCGDFSIVKYKSMKATGEAVSDLYSENSKPFIIDTDMSLNAGLIEDVDTSEIVEKTNLPAKSDEDIIVAVVDTGFDPEQSPYADRVVEGIDLTGTGAMTDQNGHGTLMTNIILQYSGQNVKVMPIKVMADDSCRTSTLFEGMLEAVDSGADIVNVSMSSLFVESGDYSEQICAYAKSKNVPIVIAAGNNNMNTYSTVPANNYSGIVVSALDENNKKAGYSNNGDNVDVCSYGAVNVYDKYSCGTSVSAALVSSTLADNMQKDYTIDDFESLIGKLVKPMGEPEEVVTYGLGLIIPEDFKAIEDEQSVSAEAGKIYNLPWKELSDDYLNMLILNKTSEYELRYWVDSLSEDDVALLLSRDTVMSQPYSVSPITEEVNGDKTEGVISEETTESYDTYYDYIKGLDTDTVVPVVECKLSPLIVKLIHNPDYDPANGGDAITENYTTPITNYMAFNPKQVADLTHHGAVGTTAVWQSGSNTSATGTTSNRVFEQRDIEELGTGKGAAWVENLTKCVTIFGSAFRLYCDDTPSDLSGLYNNRVTVTYGPTGTALGGYANLKLNFTILDYVSKHSGANVNQQPVYEGDFIDMLDKTTKIKCTGNKAHIQNIGFSVGVCKSCASEDGKWFKKEGGDWKPCTGDDKIAHEGNSNAGCARNCNKTVKGDDANLGDGYKAKWYHVNDNDTKKCAFGVKTSPNMHGPFSSWIKTNSGWMYPTYKVNTYSNDIKGAKGKRACTVTYRVDGECTVCGEVVNKVKVIPQGHKCETGDDYSGTAETSSDGDFADSMLDKWCGRHVKKNGDTVENCAKNHKIEHYYKVRYKYITQDAAGNWATAWSNYAVSDWLCSYICPHLDPGRTNYSPAQAYPIMGAGNPYYMQTTVTSVANNAIDAKPQTLDGYIYRNKYDLGISVVNDTPYPAEAGDKVATITGTAVDQNVNGAISGVGTTKRFCSGDSVGLPLTNPTNTITATCTPKKGYKFVGWYYGTSAATATLLTTEPTATIDMPASNCVLIAHVVGVTYKVRLYGNKLPAASTEIRNINPNGFVYQVRAVNTVNGPMTVDPKDYLTWNAIKVGQLINGVPNDAFFYTTTFQVGNAACALPSVSQYCYELPGYEPVKHTTTVYPNVAEGAVQDNPNAKVKNLIQHIDWDWHLYVGNDPVTGQKGSEAAHPFKDTTGTYQNGIYKGSNTATPGVQSWDLQLTESGYADLYPVWTPIEYGIYYDKNGRGADDRRAGDLVLVDGATGGYNPFSDSFDDVLMVYQFDQTYQYPESRWTRARGWGDSIFTGWSDRDTAIEPGSKRSAANFMWDWEAGDEFTNLTKICGTDYHRYAIFNDKPYVKAKDIYDRNGNVAKLAQEMPGEDGKYIVSKSKLEEYILTMKQPVDRTDTKNQYFRGEQPAYWWDRELGTFELGNYDEPGTFQSFGGKTRYWIEFIELEDMGNISGVDKDFMDANPDYIVVDPSEHDVVTFEIHYSIQDELKNYYTVTQKLYAGFWTKIDVDVN